MAIYHCSIKPISRGAGRSIVAAAAYRHACKLEDVRTGEVHDYRRKQGLEHSAIYLPSGVNPAWAQDRGQLWNAAEAAEKRKDARLGREIVLALPDELSAEQRRELTERFCRHLANRYSLAVDVAIHQPSDDGDKRNHHAHILMSSRIITPEGFGKKVRELDSRDDGPAEVEHIRAEWARLANRALERAGESVQIDHRSFQRQGIKRMPTCHLGPSASAMERERRKKGEREIPRLVQRNEEIQVINTRAAELERKLEQEQKRITVEKKESELKESAEKKRIDFEITAYIASEMFNGDAKALLVSTKYPTRQINTFLDMMKSIDIVDENYKIMDINLNSFCKEKAHNFCMLKKEIKKGVSFQELSLSGIISTLATYNHIKIEYPKQEIKEQTVELKEHGGLQRLNPALQEKTVKSLREEDKADMEQSYKAWAERARKVNPKAWEEADKAMDYKLHNFEKEITAANVAVNSAKMKLENYEHEVSGMSFFAKVTGKKQIETTKAELMQNLGTAEQKRIDIYAQDKANRLKQIEAQKARETRQKAWEASPEAKAYEERRKARQSEIRALERAERERERSRSRGQSLEGGWER